MISYYIHMSIQLLMLNQTLRSALRRLQRDELEHWRHNKETAAVTEKIHDAVE